MRKKLYRFVTLLVVGTLHSSDSLKEREYFGGPAPEFFEDDIHPAPLIQEITLQDSAIADQDIEEVHSFKKQRVPLCEHQACEIFLCVLLPINFPVAVITGLLWGTAKGVAISVQNFCCCVAEYKYVYDCCCCNTGEVLDYAADQINRHIEAVCPCTEKDRSL